MNDTMIDNERRRQTFENQKIGLIWRRSMINIGKGGLTPTLFKFMEKELLPLKIGDIQTS